MKCWTGNIKWVHILRDSFTVCALLFCCPESRGAIMVTAHVSAARGQGLLLHPLTHTSTHVHGNAHIFFILSSGYIIFTQKGTQTHIQVWNFRPFPLSICRGYLCDTSSHPVCDSSPLITHTSVLAHGSWDTPWCIKGDKAVIGGTVWPRVTGTNACMHRRMMSTLEVLTGNSRGIFYLLGIRLRWVRTFRIKKGHLLLWKDVK